MNRNAPCILSLCAFLAACGSSNESTGALTIHILGTTDAFPHADGYAGQTARSVRGGIRSLSLLRTTDDTQPLVLFNHGANPVEVGFNHGDDTVVASVPRSATRPGRFTWARMVQTHSRFQVDACLHTPDALMDGSVDEIIVMSNGTHVDGALRNAGHHHSVFKAGDVVEERDGDDWTVPGWSSTAGAWAVVEGGEWAVYFPVDVDLDAASQINIRVNMDQAFRWEDSGGQGHRAGVWDIAEPSSEPVMRFGGNRFDVTVH